MIQKYVNTHWKQIDSIAYTMQNSPQLGKPIPSSSTVFRPSYKAVQLSDKLQPLRDGPFKVVNKRTEVTCELSTQKAKKTSRRSKSIDSLLS